LEVRDVIPSKLKVQSLPWEPIQIMPLGDIQWGAPGVDKKRLKAHVQWGADHGVFWIGMGDYTDILSPSNRRYLKNAGLYDNATEFMDRYHREHMDEVADILSPTKGMWLGMHEGHHYWEYSNGVTSDQELCMKLDAPFLGTAAVTRLSFRGKHNKAVDCLIWSHHGEGGGQDPLNRLLRVAPGFPQIDIFLQGHNTQIDARPKDNIWFYGGPGELHMRNKTQMFVATGGFMQGYNQGSTVAGRPNGSYVEKGMMRPTALGGALITVTPRHKTDFNELDIKCSV
jgi:hypothetical protein